MKIDLFHSKEQNSDTPQHSEVRVEVRTIKSGPRLFVKTNSFDAYIELTKEEATKLADQLLTM